MPSPKQASRSSAQPRPFEPNRLRQSVAPNTLRGFDTPGVGSWLASGTTLGGRARAGAPKAAFSMARSRPSMSPRLLVRVGLLLAVAGVLPFLNTAFVWQEVGLGMMCAGVGLLLLAGLPRILQGAGPGNASLLAVLVGARQRAAVPLLGGCLLLAGLFLLVDAALRG